ncbi:MAG: DNA polymerase III subunit gamma/tau [Alphaproteobacteria bacterium CG11_big_fil_rev_8_21_14_0_20_39_49]|nr:MAG: DNA polymerase III subunit gamma/tau [Alphaproteobacteria bacterium CG11_big_fil_rev_8_21_14_0_20_39_49]
MTQKEAKVTKGKKDNYKVLALKYRPDNFDDLIGQEVLVRTITNAIKTNRIANAFLLTGIRGVGKTTTARIISRVLNCVGKDGKGGATASPCGVCVNCIEIKEDRHPDVLEMDAASHTGVDDIREIIDNSRYLPTTARYKIYIIDEVHMLSKNAFNALLKTLEEPPAHVKFIFATTEIRKIPVTILSRCQRFDLRRIDNEILVPFLQKVSEKEGAAVDKEAIEMIAHASEGSVRDSLSLLDQAISHSGDKITAKMAQDMLGLADKGKIIDIFDFIAKGDIENALSALKDLYDASADPVLVLNDLLEFSYIVTKLKIIPNLNATGFIPENEFKMAKEIAEKLDIPYLTRCWQMLLKGLNEAKTAPNTFNAVEMIMIRLAHLSNLPSPAALIKKIQNSDSPPPTGGGSRAGGSYSMQSAQHAYQPQSMPQNEAEGEPVAFINSFEELVELFKINKEVLIHSWLVSDASLISFKQGRLELSLTAEIPSDFPQRVSGHLRNWTGQNWVVVASNKAGSPSLLQQKINEEKNLKKELSKHPNVNKILELFPGAYISKVEEK